MANQPNNSSLGERFRQETEAFINTYLNDPAMRLPTKPITAPPPPGQWLESVPDTAPITDESETVPFPVPVEINTEANDENEQSNKPADDQAA